MLYYFIHRERNPQAGDALRKDLQKGKVPAPERVFALKGVTCNGCKRENTLCGKRCKPVLHKAPDRNR